MENQAPTVSGDELVADLVSQLGLGIGVEYAYWMGVTADCPANQIDVGGLHFPKMQELFVPDPNQPVESGKKIRVPVVGGLNKHVNSLHIEALRRDLKRVVIRFTREKDQQQPTDGSGVNTKENPIKRARKGYAVTIPTKAQIAAAKKEKRTVPRYVRQPDDRPASDFMYLILCTDQEDPQRGGDREPTPRLSETGIVWPGDLRSAEDELMS